MRKISMHSTFFILSQEVWEHGWNFWAEYWAWYSLAQQEEIKNLYELTFFQIRIKPGLKTFLLVWASSWSQGKILLLLHQSQQTKYLSFISISDLTASTSTPSAVQGENRVNRRSLLQIIEDRDFVKLSSLVSFSCQYFEWWWPIQL